MFGSRQLSAGSISAGILRCAFHYATILGITWFGIRPNRLDGCLVAKNRYWYKWFCLLTRVLICCLYGIVNVKYILSLENPYLKMLSWLRLIGYLKCACVIVSIQFWYGQQVLRLVNRLLRLFRRVKALPGCQDMHFGGKRELSLLIFEAVSLIYGFTCKLPSIISSPDVWCTVNFLGETYNAVSANMICHVCIVCYLSVGALYEHVNRHVRLELRRQLRGLELHRGGQPSRQQLKAAGYRLDECLAIYNEIEKVASIFQKLFELPLCNILLFNFMSMTFVSYFLMLDHFRGIGLWLLVVKLFSDVVLLTLAIHAAGSSSRVIRRLSLENCYVSERNNWHIKFELFFTRLNFYEFRVRPLGLFEISNNLILVYLSGLVTYLTYIMQYNMQ